MLLSGKPHPPIYAAAMENAGLTDRRQVLAVGDGLYTDIRGACDAGGFGELAFRAADPEQGPAETARCGLFATTWDRVAAGCDPNRNVRPEKPW